MLDKDNEAYANLSWGILLEQPDSPTMTPCISDSRTMTPWISDSFDALTISSIDISILHGSKRTFAWRCFFRQVASSLLVDQGSHGKVVPRFKEGGAVAMVFALCWLKDNVFKVYVFSVIVFFLLEWFGMIRAPPSSYSSDFLLQEQWTLLLFQCLTKYKSMGQGILGSVEILLVDEVFVPAAGVFWL